MVSFLLQKVYKVKVKGENKKVIEENEQHKQATAKALAGKWEARDYSDVLSEARCSFTLP